jgi:FtsH-binding integral membrane protein
MDNIAFFWSMFCVTFFITLINIFFIRSEILSVLISIGIAAIYSVYLIIDTQLIIGGREKELTMDNYVLGAVILYIDIIRLFLEILRIFGKRNN